MRNLFRIALVCMTVGIQACAPPVEKKAPPELATLAAFPQDSYQAAAQRGEPVYAINTDESEVMIYAYRGGTFAKMGHDHVVTSRDVHGYVSLAEDAYEAKADLYVPLKTLTVDEPAKRSQAGFESSLSENDIAGTRRNMLKKVLEAESYPYVFIHVEVDGGIYRQQIVKVGMTLHGVTRTITVPVEIEQTRDRLGIRGKMVLRQSDFGIEPYSVFAGALRVKDEIVLSFRLHAKRLQVPGGPG